VTDVDFRDIRITGAGGTLTGTRIGDLQRQRRYYVQHPEELLFALALATGLTISGQLRLVAL
jgi:hypothetical protein